MQPAVRRATLIALLLEAWERSGHPLGTGAALRVQEWIRQLPATASDAQLRNTLAALLTSSEAEQEAFYQLFDRCREQADRLSQAPEITSAAEDEPVAAARAGARRWRRLLVLSSVLLAAVAAGLLWQWWTTQPETREPRTLRERLSPGDTLRLSLPPAEDTATLLRAEPATPVADTLDNPFFVDSTGRATYIATPNSPINVTDTVLAQLHYHRGIDSIFILVDLLELIDLGPAVTVDPNLLEPQPLPYAEDIAPLLLNEQQQARYAFFQRWEWPLKILLALLLAGLAWAFLRWRQYRRAQVVAEIQRADRAPYVWNPTAADQNDQWVREAAGPLLNRFRGRAPDERRLLDLPGTIRTTSRRAGRIELVYKQRTLPPDYLLLIDRYGSNDHRARLYDALYRTLLAAEVPVSRYFFNGDPRLCFSEKFPQGISLVELLHRHADARLLLVGEGERLLSPATGRPAPWTHLLARWSQRALLSPRPRSVWGPQERALSQLLLLLPASPQGLGLALEAFLADEPPTQAELLEQVGDALPEPVHFRGDLLRDLRDTYPPAMIDWIAACAVWPKLSWELTLHLGELIGDRTGTPLVTFDGLRSLNRLPWFSQGEMPRRAREQLLDYLAERDLEQPVRGAIRTLLNGSPPPPADSVAYADYRMNVILNELLLGPDSATRRQLEREFADYLAAGKQPDFVALRLLDRPATRLDTLVGNRLKKYAFRQGLPGLGWRTAWPLLLGWLLLVVPLLLIPLTGEPPCTGDPIPYQGQELCLKNDADRLLFLRIQAAAAVREQDHDRVDSLRRAAAAIAPRDSAFFLNTATHYYNYGAEAYNCSIQPAATCPDELTADSLRALACANFGYARELYRVPMTADDPGLLIAQNRACPEAVALDSLEVTGRVLDAATGRPLPGAGIRLVPADRGTEAQLLAGTAPGTLGGETDPAGRFTVTGIPPTEQLRLLIRAEGYEPLLRSYTPTARTTDFRLQAQGTTGERRFLRTRLLDATTRQPVPGATVRVVGASPDPTADARGLVRYTYPAEPTTRVPGRVSCTVLAPGYLERAYDFVLFADSTRRDTVLLRTADSTPSPSGSTGEGPVAPSPLGRAGEGPPEMVTIPGGTFTMGCLNETRDGNCDDDEKPAHEVTVATFALSRYEVTNEQYAAFLNAEGGRAEGVEEWINLSGSFQNERCRIQREGNRFIVESGYERHPVIYVSWYGARAYTAWLSRQTGRNYRLPTEAEWEYAARGGQAGKTDNYLYSGSNDIDAVAWYDGNSDGGTHPVGEKQPNQLGLYDMSGNVYEWCSDWFGDYPTEAQSNPPGPDSGSSRVRRGGSWYDYARVCRSAFRYIFRPTGRSYVGFRLARS